MKIGVFAGSFDPVTKGHVNAAERAARILDTLYVVVGVNCKKKYAVSDEVRLQLARKAFARLQNAEVVLWQGLTTDFCKQVGADVLIKCVRNFSEWQEVSDVAAVNKTFWQGETLVLPAEPQYAHISSSVVRELIIFGQDISAFVPEEIATEVFAAYSGKTPSKK